MKNHLSSREEQYIFVIRRGALLSQRSFLRKITPYNDHFFKLLKSFLFFILIQNFLIPSAYTQNKLHVNFVRTLLDDTVGTAPLANPSGLAIDPRGYIYIADTDNNRILQCDQNGQFIRENGGFGFDNEQFDQPMDIWAGNGLDVIVADYNNQRLQRFDKDLNFISSFVSDPALEQTLQFGFPIAVALSSQGELYVADHEFNRMLRFDVFGEPKASFADFNWQEGGLEQPSKILISKRSEIFVSDAAQDAIVIYDAFGNFINRIGQGLLKNPGGMVGWQDAILVADRDHHRVVVILQSGETLTTFGEQSKALGELMAPVDIDIYSSQNIKQGNTITFSATVFVLDAEKNCVQVFELKWQKGE